MALTLLVIERIVFASHSRLTLTKAQLKIETLETEIRALKARRN